MLNGGQGHPAVIAKTAGPGPKRMFNKLYKYKPNVTTFSSIALYLKQCIHCVMSSNTVPSIYVVSPLKMPVVNTICTGTSNS